MRLSRPFRIAAIVIAFGALLPSAARATSQSVVIRNFSFLPQNAPINVGESITWLNNDPYVHAPTSDTGAFDAGAIQPGGNRTISFALAGTFAYHCAIHPTMKATITVIGAATPTPSTPRPTPPPTAPPTPSPTASPRPSPTPSPSPTTDPSPSAPPTPVPTTTVAPAPSSAAASPSPAPGPDLGSGPGPILAAGGLAIAVALGGVAVYLYRRR